MIGFATAKINIFSLYGKLRENEKDNHKMIIMSLTQLGRIVSQPSKMRPMHAHHMFAHQNHMVGRRVSEMQRCYRNKTSFTSAW